MLQSGLALPPPSHPGSPLPIPAPPTRAPAPLAWKNLCRLCWDGNKRGVLSHELGACGGEYICMDSPPTGRVCVTRTCSLDGIFWLRRRSRLTSPPTPARVKRCRANVWGLSGGDTAPRAAGDVSRIRLGWVKWLNVLSDTASEKPCIPSLPKRGAPPGLLRGLGLPRSYRRRAGRRTVPST